LACFAWCPLISLVDTILTLQAWALKMPSPDAYVRTTTKSGHTERLVESLRLRLLQSIAIQTHPPPKQDQLTCNPLDLSPTDWYGCRGHVSHPQTNGMVERFNARISEVVNQTRFTSAADLEATLNQYVKSYNHLIPQRALNHISPVQALKDSHAKKS